MIDSRRCDNAQRPSGDNQTPESSGPRYGMPSAIALARFAKSDGANLASLATIPAMPHTAVTPLYSRHQASDKRCVPARLLAGFRCDSQTKILEGKPCRYKDL